MLKLHGRSKFAYGLRRWQQYIRGVPVQTFEELLESAALMRDGLETLIIHLSRKSGLKDKLGPTKTQDRAQNHVSLTSKTIEIH